MERSFDFKKQQNSSDKTPSGIPCSKRPRNGSKEIRPLPLPEEQKKHIRDDGKRRPIPNS